jgi:hypothetical protein
MEIFGIFDGQCLLADDGKLFPVPSNYASKSKLLEGDSMKLTITPDAKFIYKTILKVKFRQDFAKVIVDENGKYCVLMQDGSTKKVLHSSITYFKLSPDDIVIIQVPEDNNIHWVAIETVMQ